MLHHHIQAFRRIYANILDAAYLRRIARRKYDIRNALLLCGNDHGQRSPYWMQRTIQRELAQGQHLAEVLHVQLAAGHKDAQGNG